MRDQTPGGEKAVARRLQRWFLNKGLTINLTDRGDPRARSSTKWSATSPSMVGSERAGESTAPHKVKGRTFHYPGGLVDRETHQPHQNAFASTSIGLSGKGHRGTRWR